MPARLTRTALGAAAVAAVAVVPIAPLLRAGFMYDDTTLIRDNAWMHRWHGVLDVWTHPYWPTVGPDRLGLYRPLHVALLTTVWNLGGGTALAFHLYTLALAGCAAVAVWWMLRRATSAGAAFAGALIFASHPLHVEAVASAANSAELLVALATIALVALLWRRDAMSRGRWTLVALAAVAALLSKESGLLSLPVALVTVWGWRAAENREATSAPQQWRDVVRRDARGLLLAAAGLAAALVARRLVLGAAVTRTSIAAQGMPEPAGARIEMMLALWPRLASMLVWPSSLAPYYGPTLVPAHRLAVALLAAACLASAGALAVLAARRGDRRPLVALAWLVLSYLPASNLLVATGQIMSDRTLYGASIGTALAAAWLVEVATPRARRVLWLAVAALVLHGVGTSTTYAFAWRTHRALWTRLIAMEPAEHLGYKLLGMDARARGEQARAVMLLAQARAMAPADRQIRFEYAQALYATGRHAEAAAELGRLLRDRDVRDEPGTVGLYLDAVGRSRGAQAVVDAAHPLLGSASGAAAALYAAVALERLGRPAAADSMYGVGLRIAPGDTALLARRDALRRTTTPAAGYKGR